TDNERPVVQWQEGDVTYTHNKDDFSLVAKHPDGRTEHYVLRPDGVLWSGDHAYVVGVMAPDGNITPVSAQDDVAYRSWLANGGEGSYHEWVAQGKPAEVVQGIDQAPAGTVRDRNVKGPDKVAPEVPTYETPFNPLTKTQRADLKAKLDSRTISKEEYQRLEWDRQFANRRATGVRRFCVEERSKLRNVVSCTRNWTAEHREAILAGKRPQYNGETIQGHHKYNALDHP